MDWPDFPSLIGILTHLLLDGLTEEQAAEKTRKIDDIGRLIVADAPETTERMTRRVTGPPVTRPEMIASGTGVRTQSEFSAFAGLLAKNQS